MTTYTKVERIKRINSHAGHHRFLNSVISTDLVIPRIKDIPAPYSYSPTHRIYRDELGRNLIVVETSHKQYDVFLVPADVQPVKEVF